MMNHKYEYNIEACPARASPATRLVCRAKPSQKGVIDT